MFARWSQENFIKYMRQHYNIDRLIDYSLAQHSRNQKELVGAEWLKENGYMVKWLYG